ncbi:hypothetical protein HCY52_14895 [Acinetobacter radioresistens]|uniref:hypothetical protein n=1 Tax=Acinetobacter radioresistens TaxID=40216 RepID=UPI002004A428|nr:hypothetical protein [Acinetobacter radioresistens]MCK4085099.1 hypothetical protein [Acinetobacter radioresistens]
MKLIKNALYITVLSTLIIGCGVKKENPDNASDEGPTPEFTEKVNNDVASLNASITQGVNQLKNMNDPNLNEIYSAINSLTAESTVDDLKNINILVYSHLQALKSGQVPQGMPQPIVNPEDNSLISQLAQAQQAAAQAQSGPEVIKTNLEKLKALNKTQYDQINSFVSKVDLSTLGEEDMKQLNNIIVKAINDAQQGT